jgi:hypothetical protein
LQLLDDYYGTLDLTLEDICYQMILVMTVAVLFRFICLVFLLLLFFYLVLDELRWALCSGIGYRRLDLTSGIG